MNFHVNTLLSAKRHNQGFDMGAVIYVLGRIFSHYFGTFSSLT